MTDLFTSPVLRVDQPRGAPAARSRYRVYDGQGTLLATAEERDISVLRQVARTAFGGSDAGRTVHVENGQGVPLLVVEKQNARSTRVWAPDGGQIGALQSHKLYEYALLDASGGHVGRLDGNRLGRRFAALDAYGNHVAQVEKRWKGLATEMLTTADRYSVEIYQPLVDPLRVLVVAAPLAIDLMLYEGKDWPIG